MKIGTVILAMFMALPAFAGRIITYTASSNVSQEDANNAAMAGVAKQIVSTVDASQTISKKEKTKNGKSQLDETFFSSNNVKSNLKLKGVKLEIVKAEKGFKATATLDMDEFTSDIQFQMKRIKENVEALEKSAREALTNRLYGKAANDLQTAQDMIPEYERLVWQLSKVYPLNDSHKILHNLPDLESQIKAKLETVKLAGPTETFELTKSEMPEWAVTVVDDQGPLPGFPLIAKQGRQTLSEKRTANDGKASFLLRKVNFETGPYSVTVFPNLPLSMLKAVGLDQGIEIQYTVKQSRCEIQLECSQIANFCSALEVALGKRSIFATTESAKAPKLTAQYSAIAKNSLTAGSNVLKSFDITLTIKGGDVNFATTTKGVGKNEVDAVVKAVQKTEFQDLQKQLAPHCK